LVDLGTPSAKLYTTYRPTYYADDATILRLFEAAATVGVLPLVHCENDDLVTAQAEALIAAGETGWRHHGRSRPALAEQEAVQRVLFLADAADCPVHICHCSTALSVALVAEARDGGQAVTCETCPQYLLLDDAAYEGREPWRYVLQPPLREPEERERLWALVEGGAVEMLVTDHCDYTAEQKTARDEFAQTPGGLPGMETLLSLAYTYGVSGGRLSLPRMVALLSANPARIWGLWPRKGALSPGSDADVVVYDPRPAGAVEAASLHHVAGYSPFEGMRVQGRVRATLCRGKLVSEDGEFSGEAGWGHFVRR
jgi:dihydropyrimidinase